MKLAFLGLGVMGYPLAGHLARAGHNVTVYNRTASRAVAWIAEFGGTQASTPAEAAQGCEVVMACVGNDADIAQVALGEQGALPAMSKGSIFVDHTTTSAAKARDLDAAARALGIGFIDAPVSGGQSGAEAGRLTVMCGGSEQDCERVAPIAGAYAAQWRRLGEAGSGQLTKMVNQICIAGLVQGLSEGVKFAELAGLDTKAVFETIGGGAAQSWQMDNRALTMAAREFDFGFAVEWMQKDLGFALDEAQRNGAPLPITEQVAAYYDAVADNGGRRWDTSSLVTLLDKKGGSDD